jgi:hypothetical protein
MSDPVTTPLPARLQQATAGLLLPSETDAPFEVVTWTKSHGDPTDAAVLRQASGAAADARVIETTTEALLGTIAAGHPGHDEDEKQIALRFRALADLLGALPGVRAWRVGGPDIHVWILAPSEGGWTGLRSHLVET